MPRPSTPATVDGAGLTADQMRTLSALVSVIYAPDPTRSAQAIITQAIAAFARLYRRAGDEWIARKIVQLGTSDADAVIAFDDNLAIV